MSQLCLTTGIGHRICIFFWKVVLMLAMRAGCLHSIQSIATSINEIHRDFEELPLSSFNQLEMGGLT